MKIPDLHVLAYLFDYSIICLTETWLNDTIYDKEIFSSGFRVYRKDRGSRGRGVLVAIKECLQSKLLPSPPDLEVLSIAVGDQVCLTICTVYVPPTVTSSIPTVS